MTQEYYKSAILQAIKDLKDRRGSTMTEIKNYIKANPTSSGAEAGQEQDQPQQQWNEATFKKVLKDMEKEELLEKTGSRYGIPDEEVRSLVQDKRRCPDARTRIQSNESSQARTSICSYFRRSAGSLCFLPLAFTSPAHGRPPAAAAAAAAALLDSCLSGGYSCSTLLEQCHSTVTMARTKQTAARKSVSPFIHIFSEHADCPLKKQMAELWQNEQLCDAELVASDGQKFKGHRLVLASTSDYMRALLAEDRFRDSANCPVNLPDISPSVLKLILEWMYQGRANLMLFSDAVELLESSCRLQCQVLTKELEGKLCLKTNVENCVKVWGLGERFSLDALSKRAREVCIEEFADVAKSDDFTDLDLGHIKEILQSDDLVDVDEKEVYDGVLKWANANIERETCAISDVETLIEHIRFPLIDKDYIKTTVVDEALLVENPSLFRAVVRSFGEEKSCNERGVAAIVVQGAGYDEVNGHYEICGLSDGVAMFSRTGTYQNHRAEYFVYRCKLINNERTYYISIVPPGVKPGTAKDIDFYIAAPDDSNHNLPPKTRWDPFGEGFDPAPSIKFHFGDVACESDADDNMSEDFFVDRLDYEY